MSLWKQLAGLSLGVAALVTFRFIRQRRGQNHGLEGELEIRSGMILQLQEQLEIIRQLREQNHGLEGELEIRSGIISQLQEQLEINRQEHEKQLENYVGILQVEFFS
jgi:hypothetical protein